MSNGLGPSVHFPTTILKVDSIFIYTQLLIAFFGNVNHICYHCLFHNVFFKYDVEVLELMSLLKYLAWYLLFL